MISAYYGKLYQKTKTLGQFWDLELGAYSYGFRAKGGWLKAKDVAQGLWGFRLRYGSFRK